MPLFVSNLTQNWIAQNKTWARLFIYFIISSVLAYFAVLHAAKISNITTMKNISKKAIIRTFSK